MGGSAFLRFALPEGPIALGQVWGTFPPAATVGKYRFLLLAVSIFRFAFGSRNRSWGGSLNSSTMGAV